MMRYWLRLSRVVELSKSAFQAQVEKSEKVILELAMITAERILNSSLIDYSEKFVPLVKRALKEARDYKEIQIHVHPSKYEWLTSEKNELDAIFPNDVQCYLYPNGDLDEHACYIESENGRIDASIDSQLQEIKRKLMEILEGDIQLNAENLVDLVKTIDPFKRYGKVIRVVGLMIESQGPESSVGDVCLIHVGRKGSAGEL